LAFSLFFTAYCLYYRERRGARTLTVIFVGAILWILARVLQILTPDQPAPRSATLLRLLGPEIIIIGFVLFALEFTGRKQYINVKTALLLLIKPVTTILIVLTPLRGRLLEFGTPDRMADGFEILVTPFFVVHSVYNYALTMVGMALLVHMLLNAGYSYQRQVVGLLVAFSPPIIGNVLYNVFGLFPFDPTPLLFVVTTVILMYAVFNLQFLDATPIARRTVFDEMDEMVFVVDTDGTISTVNRATAERFKPSGSLEGTHIQEILGPGVQPQKPKTESYDIETTVDGDTHHFTVTQSSLTDYRETAIGTVLVCRDITDRIERERQLEQQNERLEQFASVVSHDLRNPLQAAQGFTDIALETGEEKHLERVQDSHDRMQTMIEELLTLTRSGGDVDEEKLQQVALSAATEDAWDTAETNGVTLETALPDEWTVHADPGLFQNVLENLFRNAADHNEPPLTVRVGTFERRVGEETPQTAKREGVGDGGVSMGEQIERGFYVEDDGTGIPADERDDIFDHGYTTDQQGTGFGLSIVRDIIDAHGWTVTVTEGSDGGARFEITTERRTPS
jgi:signal transduction histidine kinase